MEQQDLNARARVIGKRIFDTFRRLQAQCPAIGDVRGLGAMIAMEFVDPDGGAPPSAMVQDILRTSLERGVLAVAAGTYGHVIRILSPLVITDAQLERGLAILEAEVLRHAATPTSPAVPAAARASQ